MILRQAGAAVMLAAAMAILLWSCGGDDGPPVCGDGLLAENEQCDDGDRDELDECRACISFPPAKTTIKWVFNSRPIPAFAEDGCSDVNAVNVRVEVVGPATASKDGMCSLRQVTFQGLPAGTYAVRVTPLNAGGQSLVTAPVTAMFETAAEPTSMAEHTVVVPPDAWAQRTTMTGTYLFQLRWGGMPCVTAIPPVTQQAVTVRIGDVVTSLRTSTTPMYALNGEPVGCVTSSSEYAMGMPFGFADVHVVGKDSAGTETFRGDFNTFIGAGVANPTLTLNVPSTIDAGVDAM